MSTNWQSTFYLLRHGQIEGPPALYGHTDVSLSDQGWQQMQLATDRIQPDLIVSSPFKRCQAFAQNLADRRKLPLHVEPALRECDFGAWDGVPYDQLADHWFALEAFWRDPVANPPPGGERLSDMDERISLCWQQLCHANIGKQTLIISHGGAIRLILAHILGIDGCSARLFSQLHISHASLTQISLRDHPDAKPVIDFVGRPATEQANAS